VQRYDKIKGMKKYSAPEIKKFAVDVMIDQAKDIAASTREARALIAKVACIEMPEMLAAQIEKAKNGDTNAFIAIWDRAFGKPLQAVEHSGNVGQPIVFMPLELIQKHNLQVVNNVANNTDKRIIDVENTAQPSPEK
jgi:hypothetical protein